MRNCIKILSLTSAIILFSCTRDTDKLQAELENLKVERDSLLDITESLKNKFVFDQARVKIVASEKNTNKLGTEYNGNFVLFAFNEDDEILFSTELDTSNFNLKNPVKLKRGFDGYSFTMKLKENSNDIHFKVNLKNKLGQNLDGITISDKKTAN